MLSGTDATQSIRQMVRLLRKELRLRLRLKLQHQKLLLRQPRRHHSMQKNMHLLLVRNLILLSLMLRLSMKRLRKQKQRLLRNQDKLAMKARTSILSTLFLQDSKKDGQNSLMKESRKFLLSQRCLSSAHHRMLSISGTQEI